ncbi:phosphopantothenoylcysteine decarboxylase / phosphopantothenate--cysteine ligase [Francisella philomiragia subsp. philomiragia ATCC 25015]|uniref:bifunctional phosphopantothenoylcysteine decarboxylase/phosphopantothenate--cysteine ligase CoaBC n=1 Tax=Francisella philomiragia TaxID=28110 RepID=UPI0001AF7AEC|nr:bifunctional phosphopantothenoylcysteine decarboxylase/phosphopantothenate--cysteine ligase CoaBC [Francisella philomiragia]AJI74449.1 phosphopantothenoylcysteine decarboxylase / phosphopantothenate--cysteine ligase [Francisella philomiragia subsp. philomiragia ATCC 25015]EET21627.1 P-pantothenate cysteine ligase/P-pantothenoylcysteine decarboxylase [Francisella philomiragia subsp. philomiragia ATCC 25015]MBK2238056.1 bifunctional phosphopantothenoylcysteine decarboxylase/phosphopantothenate-
MSNKILFGITGSVSAFKTINLIRLFIKSGVECRAIVTKGAQQFIKPELLVALGCNVYTDESLNMSEYSQSMAHINLSRWADKIFIVPASANTIAKLAHGLADDLLSQTILANEDNSKVYIAPAMNVNMWQNQLTQMNITKLQNIGFNLIAPDQGIQACGDIGSGRLHEPEVLFELLNIAQDFKAKKVVITVGATVEDIDGVRYLSNYSSGKMGFALVRELLVRGAIVVVLKAKTTISFNFNIKHPNLEIIDTKSADAMNQAMLERAKDSDIFIGCAAVADYKIKNKFTNKIKKTDETLTLEFIKNPDVLANCKKSYPSIFAIGFAAESENIVEYARSKLVKKNLNMIVANSTEVFGNDSSSVTILSENNLKEYNNISKSQVAKLILDYAKSIY